MTAARLSAAEAKTLGLDVPAANRGQAPPGPETGRRAGTKSTRTRRIAKGPYRTICHDYGETFDTQATETRHVETTRHARYDLDIGERT